MHASPIGSLIRADGSQRPSPILADPAIAPSLESHVGAPLKRLGETPQATARHLIENLADPALLFDVPAFAP